MDSSDLTVPNLMEKSIGLQRDACLNRGSDMSAHVLFNLLNK